MICATTLWKALRASFEMSKGTKENDTVTETQIKINVCPSPTSLSVLSLSLHSSTVYVHGFCCLSKSSLIHTRHSFSHHIIFLNPLNLKDSVILLCYNNASHHIIFLKPQKCKRFRYFIMLQSQFEPYFSFVSYSYVNICIIRIRGMPPSMIEIHSSMSIFLFLFIISCVYIIIVK